LKILGIIPARGGSKGIPGKNIKSLAGKPLIAYTVESIQESKLLTNAILSSDDEAIISIAKELGLKVPFIRPAELASDHSPTLPVILHALDFFSSQGEYFDAVCLLQTTTPFRTKGMIDLAIKKMIETDADALVSVLPVPHEYNPHWIFEPDASGWLKIATGEEKIIPRRPELPATYFRDGAIYITKTSVLLKNESLYGQKLTFILGDQARYVNLDTLEDWRKAELLVQNLFPGH